ncbi:MAG: histidine phosphatase family protein [Lachnospiraceae bacterium]|nr:histidine phosphatase family protein [Lachnospiraceae bacterium]
MDNKTIEENLLDRLFLALNRIMEEVKENIVSGRDVLILTHGAVIMSLLTLKNDLDFKTSYTVINIGNAQAIKLEPNDIQETQQKLYLKSVQ